MFDPDLCSKCQSSTLGFTPRVALDSSFNTKLRSEAGPYAMDQEEADELLLSCNLDLDDYDAELARLRVRIMFIEQQKEYLRIYKEKIPSMPAPIQKLPNELLACIFSFVCDWNFLQEFPWTITKNPLDEVPTTLTLPIITYLPALVLSSTNARWRNLAISLPNLWSRLRLEITSEEKAKPADHLVSLVDLFISRSRDYPLDIELTILGEPQGDSPRILERLGNQSHRWKTFMYDVGDYPFRRYFPRVLQADFSKLEFADVWYSAGDENEPNLFQAAPMLKELRALTLAGKWHQLTHLTFSPFYAQWDDILDICPNLVSLELLDWKSRFDINRTLAKVPPNGPRTVERIHSLKLALDKYDLPLGLLETVLSAFILPSLKNVTITTFPRSIHWQYDREWCPISFWQSFISRSSCSITTLDLRTYKLGFSDADLISLLQLLPSLQDFMLGRGERHLKTKPKSSPISTKLIRNLDRSLITPLVPNLHTLVMVHFGESFDDEAFIQMISSRWLIDPKTPAVNRLREVELFFEQREVDEAVYRPLRDLDKMGLRVTIVGLNNTKV